MNHFLQRMLKKNEDETDGEKVNSDGTTGLKKVEYSPSGNKSSNWMKKFGSSSPKESDLAVNRKSPSRPMTLNLGENRNDRRRKIVAQSMAPKTKMENERVPSIERIRREFEMGFMSPTKQESIDTTKSGRFVKKIVAAFEEKYKTLGDVKTQVKKSSIESDSSKDSCFEEEDTDATEGTQGDETILGNTYVVESLESRLCRYLDSYIATSSVRDEETRSEEEDTSLDLGKYSFAMDKDESSLSERGDDRSPGNEKSVHESEISLKEVKKVKPISPLRNLVRRDSSIRGPKIVGAYLKKPIEVEDTSIDWIPITGKKLPRKRSFKKLLSMLTRKKSSAKSSKLYSSEMNLQEETTRELLQDSGYDEKSGSSSSLVSLVSINDLLLQEKNRYSEFFEEDRRAYFMTTFRQRTTHPPIVDNDPIVNDRQVADDDSSLSINDDVSEACSSWSKKLMLEEVSRSELRLSLGPAFPSAAGAKVICSLDRRETKSVWGKSSKNDWTMLGDIGPLAPQPPLPKHPFVSSKKKTCREYERFDFSNQEANRKDDGAIFSEFGKKIQSPNDSQTWTFPTGETTYDTPRRYLSKSEPGLVSIGKRARLDDSSIENVYDVPRPEIRPRPRSSIYDDALSLKRRNDNFSSDPPALPAEFYGFSSNREPHYATVKPRNAKINPSKELLRSLAHFYFNDPNSSDYYYSPVIDAPTH